MRAVIDLGALRLQEELVMSNTSGTTKTKVADRRNTPLERLATAPGHAAPGAKRPSRTQEPPAVAAFESAL